MLTLRTSSDRGFADHGWLQSHHSFSFAEYHDPRFMGHGNLRVLNEDRIAPGQGFGMHGHRDMEIVSYVMHGALRHQDSMGNTAEIRPGDVQRMTAGQGVQHSEHNASATETAHFLQIWLLPSALGLPPSYAQKHFSVPDRQGRLALVASADDAPGAIKLSADARIYAGLLDGAAPVSMALNPQRKAYVHLVNGRLRVNGQALDAGDAAALQDCAQLELAGAQEAQVLVFDLLA
jgi:quercetin 2,3-dioxygenase